MHCSTIENDVAHRMEGGDVLVAIAALVIEGRIPGKQSSKNLNFHSGPHSDIIKNPHNCDFYDPLCLEFAKVKNQVLELWQKGIPLCIDVLLTPACCTNEEDEFNGEFENNTSGILVEQWIIRVDHRRTSDKSHVNLLQLVNAVRSQLYFSQLSSWLSLANDKITKKNIHYNLTVPGETYQTINFTKSAIEHNFPISEIGNGLSVQVSLLSLPRTSEVPVLQCQKCSPPSTSQPDHNRPNHTFNTVDSQNCMFDDRMHTNCNLNGKHRCEDYDDVTSNLGNEEDFTKFKRICNNKNNLEEAKHYPSTSKCEDFSRAYKKPQTSTQYLRFGCCSTSTRTNKNGDQIAKSFSSSPPLNSSAFGLNPLDTFDRNLLSPAKIFNSSDSTVGASSTVTSGSFSPPHEPTHNDLNSDKKQSKSDLLLDAILRSCRRSSLDSTNVHEQSTNSVELRDRGGGDICVQNFEPAAGSSSSAKKDECDINSCDNNKSCGNSDMPSIRSRIKFNLGVDKHCDSPIPRVLQLRKGDGGFGPLNLYKSKAKQRITFDDWKSEKKGPSVPDPEGEVMPNCQFIENEKDRNKDKGTLANGIDVPSAVDQIKFKKSLDNATSMVFHSRTGLPLTSSPAPIRRGKSSFDYDSSINSVSAIGNALFSPGSDEENESDSSIVSPRSPDSFCLPKKEPSLVKYYRRGHPNNLLGTFEESVLNGRLEPVSTVHGFTAELGASGSFVPRHVTFPVTVFFYNLGDNDKVSTPYLGHINLGRKGYQVPRSGTIQVTLFNPLGTVVKMFVILYDLSDMPPYSQTFLRQRTLYMPTKCQDQNLEWGPKWLRYLIHLRFTSSKSGKIYLHKDIRMIIFRKTDLDTATAHGIDMAYELRSFTHTPTNPKFSPRK